MQAEVSSAFITYRYGFESDSTQCCQSIDATKRSQQVIGRTAIFEYFPLHNLMNSCYENYIHLHVHSCTGLTECMHFCFYL